MKLVEVTPRAFTLWNGLVNYPPIAPKQFIDPLKVESVCVQEDLVILTMVSGDKIGIDGQDYAKVAKEML